MRSAHLHRSCFTGEPAQNPKMTPILRIKHFAQISRKMSLKPSEVLNISKQMPFVEYKRLSEFKLVFFSFFEVIWVISGPCAWGSGIPPIPGHHGLKLVS